MLTRCAACGTHFRVTPEQLKARSGRVRCGECQHVFNALDSLIEEPMAVMVSPAAESQVPPDFPEPLYHIAEDAATYHPEAGTDEVGELPPPVPDAAETPDPETEQADDLPPLPAAPAQPPIAEFGDAAEPDAAELEAAEPDAAELEAAEPEAAEPVAEIAADTAASDWSELIPVPPRRRRWPWVIGSLVALGALGLQAVLAFRIELAVLWPESRPGLVALCDVAGCEVGLPAKPALIGIEASDLHPDTGHAGRLVLSATLKNRAPFAQQFPHLELTLTDTADKAIARKVLAPADYLPQNTSPARGMQPGADIAVAVAIDSGEMNASGYRLYLFYP